MRFNFSLKSNKITKTFGMGIRAKKTLAKLIVT